MKKLLQGWIFYTALLCFLLAAAITLPELTRDFWGDTEQEITQAVDDFSQKAVAVWGQSFP